MFPLVVLPSHLLLFLGVEQAALLLIYILYYGIFSRSVLLQSIKYKDPLQEPLISEDSQDNIETAVGSSTDLFPEVKTSLIIKNHVFSCIRKLLDQNWHPGFKKIVLITNGNRTNVFLDMIKYFYFKDTKEASHSFIPRNEYEISIEKGDKLEIHSFVDGIMVKGNNLTRKTLGIFPSYCICVNADIKLEMISFKMPKENTYLENITTIIPNIRSFVSKDLEQYEFEDCLAIASGLHYDETFFHSHGIKNVQFVI
ncbi:hypothetical protein HDV04_004812 [Boothiomyces sp. JEL0838]|nr:hypothetical protein HDV04_004812 [Boothiomyces sp. JEL0838]